MALIRSVKADPGTMRNAVIDLDLATDDRQGAAGTLHAPRFGEPGRPRRAEPHHRAQPHAGRGFVRGTAGVRNPLHALLQLDADGDRRASTCMGASCAPMRRSCRCFRASSTATPSTGKIRLDAVIHERDRAAFAAALEKAGQRQADIAPIDTVAAQQRGAPCPLLRQRGGRRHRRRGGRGSGDRLCGRHDRAEGARRPDGAEPEDAGGRAACRRHRARLQQCADRHHHGVGPAAGEPSTVGPVLPRHHEHQAERQPRGLAGAAVAGFLAQADVAARGAEPYRRAWPTCACCWPVWSATRSSSRSITGATCGRSRSTSGSSSRWW